MPFYERYHAGAALRLAGLALLGQAALIARHLFTVADPTAKYRVLPYVLALTLVMSASIGAALALFGRHLFDQVELPARWAIHIAPGNRSGGLAARDREGAAT